MENEDIYVFLSHSNKDFDRVRTLRNLLEEKGFRPIMFYLKCMEDESKLPELNRLIYDEIDHRNRFIYCKSENSIKSHWCSLEIEHLKSTNRTFDIVNIEKASDEELEQYVNRYNAQSMVAISSPSSLRYLACYLMEELEQFAYFKKIKILGVPSSKMNDINEFDSTINKCVRENGWFIIFINKDIIPESFSFQELLPVIESGNQNILVVSDSEVSLDKFKGYFTHENASNLKAIILNTSYSNANTPDTILWKVIMYIFNFGDVLSLIKQAYDSGDIVRNSKLRKLADKIEGYLMDSDKYPNPMAYASIIGGAYEKMGGKENLKRALDIYSYARHVEGMQCDAQIRRIKEKLKQYIQNI